MPAIKYPSHIIPLIQSILYIDFVLYVSSSHTFIFVNFRYVKHFHVLDRYSSSSSVYRVYSSGIERYHCRQRAPVGNVLSSSGTSQLGMFDIQATTKSKSYDHIVLLYLESRKCRYRSIIFACFYLYITVVSFIDYSDIDKMMDINNEKC